MSATLDQCKAWLAYANTRAFLRCIRAGESGQNDNAYTVINGGQHFFAPPWVHPFAGMSAPPGRAAGAYQFIPHTWQAVEAALGLPDFSPESQDIGAVYLIAEAGAINDVLAGNLVASASRLRNIWISLPEMSLQRLQAIFTEYGGKPGQEATPEAATAPPSPAAPQPVPTQPAKPTGGPMGALSLLSMLSPILSGILPQIAPLWGPKAQQYAGIAQTVVDTIKATAQTDSLESAVVKMQTDPAVKTAVQAAVVSHPEVIGLMEIGGGVKAARDAGLAAQSAEKPFYYNPTFVVTALFFPMMYMIVAAVLFTVYIDPSTAKDMVEAFTALPFYAKVGFDQATRSGLVNLIVGMVIGGVVGVWFGTSYGSQRKTEIAATQGLPDAAKP